MLFLFKVDQTQYESAAPSELAEALSKLETLPEPPEEWVRWLEKWKKIRPATIRVYRHDVSQFLAVMTLINPEKPPSLKMAWNLSLCELFFSVIGSMVCLSTIINYHNALISVRTFLKRSGVCPKDVDNIMDNFRDLLKHAQKQKQLYISRRKERVLADSSLLWLFYREVYHGPKLLRRFYRIADRIKGAVKKNEPVDHMSADELAFMNSFLICILTANNFHRTGNICLIEYDQARVEINRARKALQSKFPGMKLVSKDQRRLNSDQCEPAVLIGDGATKSGGIVNFVLLPPRDLDLFSLYIKIRNYGPVLPKTSQLLINSRGQSIGPSVAHYLRKIGEFAHIKGLNCQMLRSLMETENVLNDPEAVPGSSNVSAHLDHTNQTRKKYYVHEGKRHSIQAAFRMRSKFEDIGENDDHPVSKKKALYWFYIFSDLK